MVSSPTFIAKLQTAVKASDKHMETYRSKRVEALKYYVGVHYGAGGSVVRAPLNMIFSAVSVLVPHLVSQNPHVETHPKNNPALRPFAETFRLAIEYVMREIELSETLMQIVFDSMFGAGIAKVGIFKTGEREVHGYTHDLLQPFVDRVDLDDYFCDMSTKRRDKMRYEGNRYRVPLAWAKETYDNAEMLDPHYQDEQAGDTAHKIGGRGGIFDEEIEDYVEIQDVWLPDEGLLLTIPGEGQGTGALDEVEWEGPERGPYGMLGYYTVPDNLLPLAPVAMWRDLHEMINTLARKFKNKTERQKDVGYYEAKAADDADRVKTAADGDMVRVDNAQGIGQMKFGGVDNAGWFALGQLMQYFSRQAGGIDQLGGLRSEAQTATEAGMLQGNMFSRLGYMESRIYQFTKKIMGQIAHYLFYDPEAQIPVVKEIVGTDIKVQEIFSADRVEGDLMDYAVDIEPYSMRIVSREEQAKRIVDWATGIVLPTAQLSAAQGHYLDVPKLVKVLADKLDISEADELYVEGAPMQAPAVSGGGRQEQGGGGARPAAQGAMPGMGQVPGEQSQPQPQPEAAMQGAG